MSDTPQKQTYEYGAMSSRYALEAESHLVAITAMLLHYGSSNHMLVVYEPKGVPSWFNITGKISARLEEIFGEDVEAFYARNQEVVTAAYKSIRQLV